MAPGPYSRLVYFGTPELAVPPLLALHGAGHEVALVVSRPDRRRGRGGALTPSPVKAVALELGLPVTSDPRQVIEKKGDLGIVVAYGRLIDAEILEALPLVNLHFSLLPRWRGAAPVERAILAGDTVTGVCLMALEAELDTGPVYACRSLDIGAAETLIQLRQRLVDLGTSMLLGALAGGLGDPVPQSGAVSYAHKVERHELALDWRRPAAELHRVCRLGRAWTRFRDRRLVIHTARPVEQTDDQDLGPGELRGPFVGTGQGVLELIDVQPEGRARQSFDTWRNGARLGPDERLG